MITPEWGFARLATYNAYILRAESEDLNSNISHSDTAKRTLQHVCQTPIILILALEFVVKQPCDLVWGRVINTNHQVSAYGIQESCYGFYYGVI